MFFWKSNIRSHNLDRMCKQQTSVSHSSTESEVVFSGAGLRMDGVPPLDLWDVATEVLHSSKNTHQAVGDRCWKEKVDDQVPEKSSAQWNPKRQRQPQIE